MSVLPPASAHALPLKLEELIKDVRSELADFYPTDFKRDLNGQRYAWMGVNILPFIEENRMLSILARYHVQHFMTR
jgi:5'-3' exonuclease